MGRNNEDFFTEHAKNHAAFWDWDGNGSHVAYTDVRKGTDHPDVQHAFLNGHCHGLACHINRLNGNPIGRVVQDDEFEGTETVHFFNYDHKDPSMGIDIHGKRPIEDIMDNVLGTYDGHHERVTPEQMHSETTSTDKWLPISHGASEQVAKAIIRKL